MAANGITLRRFKNVVHGMWSNVGVYIPYKLHLCQLEKSSPKICRTFNHCPEIEGMQMDKRSGERPQLLDSGTITDINMVIVIFFAVLLPFLIAVKVFCPIPQMVLKYF
ncbi:hypothetical protein KR018_008471 [Drosophila ironensis]|nr:hypothetical protein KR018_008471 [Drosophila ironensis]